MTADPAPVAPRMRARQLGTVVRLELGKALWRKRALWLYLLALLPVVPIGGHTIETILAGSQHTLIDDSGIFATIFQLYYLRLGLFFACLGVFTRLFRGEIMERSLHYYLLMPLRRELLALGKFIAGVIATVATFAAGVIIAFVVMYIHHDEARAFLLGAGLRELAGYLGVVTLGALGYGAVFLLLGLVVKNPIVPAVVLLAWEGINHVVPASLKPLSVIYYLEPLLPVTPPAKDLSVLFAIPADPLPPYLAIPGVLLVTAAIVAFACLRARQAEVNYSTDS